MTHTTFQLKWLPLLLVLVTSVSLLSGCAATQSKVEAEKGSRLLSTSVVDPALAEDDFAFPPAPMSLSQGKTVFEGSCLQCHAASSWQNQKIKEDLAYTTPIDLYLFLSTGKAPQVEMPTEQRKQVLPATHAPGPLKDKIERPDRWAAILYVRYLAGAGDITDMVNVEKETTVASVFGGNCAVCHGTRGQADGPLHTGKTGNHALKNAELHNDLVPAPANFQDFRRVFNRTDAQLFKYICQGIYPSAMPSWYGNVNLDKDTKMATYVFNDKLIMDLVRHIRSFTVVNDLKDAKGDTPPAPPGLDRLQGCAPAPTNRPWTHAMTQNTPGGFAPVPLPRTVNEKDITGGMVLPKSPHASAGHAVGHEQNDDMESRR